MKWTIRRKHVSVETGELLTETELHKYYKIKTIKRATANQTTQRGTIEYTIEYRARDRYQGKLL